MKPIAVEIVTDLTCPWYWINHRILMQSIAEMRARLAATVEYTFVEVNPDLPPEGMRRREFRIRKFGSRARAELMDRIAWKAGRRVGATLNFALIKCVPNTRLAHRLVAHVQRQDLGVSPSELTEALFSGYFSQGLDIGSPQVLQAIGLSQGMRESDLEPCLAVSGNAGDVESRQPEPGFDQLPRLRIADASIDGVQSASVIRRTLRAASMFQP